MNKEEIQYFNMLHKVRTEGVSRQDRTGVGSTSGFFGHLEYDLRHSFPLYTHRFTSMRFAFEEMMLFLRGQTQTKILEEKGINIWKGNTSREFLDKRGLGDLPEGDLGKGYSHQIRNFGGRTLVLGEIEGSHRSPVMDPITGETVSVACLPSETTGTEPPFLTALGGFDQLSYLIHNIKTNPNDRRHLMSYWHPHQVLSEAALAPCHLMVNCQILEGTLNLLFYMRSNDLVCGHAINVAGYAFLTHLLAAVGGLQVGKLGMVIADPHIYTNHLDRVPEILALPLHPFPTFHWNKKPSTLEEALALQYSDIEIRDYIHGPRMKFEMAV